MAPIFKHPPEKIKKRDGRIVPFEQERITVAITKAMQASGEGNLEHDPQRVSGRVVKELIRRFPSGHIPQVEEIQDIVEEQLILMGFPKTAKAYILYRHERSRIREQAQIVPERVRELVEQSKKYLRNPYREFIYYRTYSRWLEGEGRRETWIETVGRYLDFMREKLGKRLTEDEYEEIRQAILNQEVMPSMRMLWAAGPAARATDVCIYNCSFIAPTRLEDFAEIMYLLMCGTGVGFSVENQNVQQLPIIRYQKNEKLPIHIVADSKEGWGDALKLGFKTWYSGKDIEFDYSQLRPAGARLKTMGGRSSGPEPLKGVLEFTRAKILSRQGRRLSNLDVHDIACKIAEVIVVGGVRRCLPQNTLIHTRGGLKPIKNIRVGDEVLAAKGQYRKVVASQYTGKRQLVNIHTQLGTFQSTPEHRWAVLSDLDGNTRWVEAHNLTSNDTLVHIPDIIPGRRTTLPPYHYQKPKHSTTTIDITVPELDEEIAWLIGYLHGDGYVYCRDSAYGEVIFACSPDMMKTAERIKKNLARFGVNPKIVTYKGDRAIRIRVKSNQLANYFYQFKRPKKSIMVPDFILEGIAEIRGAYIAGVFDSDGSIKARKRKRVRPSIMSIYPDWLCQLRALLASIGISSRIRQNRPAMGNWKPLYNLATISIEALHNFSDLLIGRSEKWENDASLLERKKEQNSFVVPRNLLAVSAYRNQFESTYYAPSSVSVLSVSRFELRVEPQNYYRPVRVKSVTKAGFAETYDIQVEGDEHFVAEGMLVHNSALLSLSDLDDEEMRKAKTGHFYLDNPQRMMANNSTVYWEKPPASKFLEEWLALAKSGTGERGIFNREGLQYQIPARRWKSFKKYWPTAGVNPCVTSDTWVMTSEGARQAGDLVDRAFAALVNGQCYPCSGFFKTGEKPVFEIETQGGLRIRATGNHRVLVVAYRSPKTQRYTWKKIEDLTLKDEIVLHNHRNVFWEGRGSKEEGWLLGNLLGDGNIEKSNKANLDYWGVFQLEMADSALALVQSTVKTRSDLAGAVTRGGAIRIGSVGVGNLVNSFGIYYGNKIVTRDIEEGSSDFYEGFLRGWFDADGSVQGTQKKGVSIRLASSDISNLEAAQRMLARLGVIGKIYKNRREASWRLMPDGRGGSKKYFCQAQHELIISGANIASFVERVNFSDVLKRAKLEKLMRQYKRGLNRETFTSKVSQIIPLGVESVYDCSVPEVNAFDGNGFYLHNCGEINLRSHGLCNLTEVVARPSDSPASLLKKIRIATILGTYQSMLTNFPYLSKDWEKNCGEERLLGVSLTGQWDSPAVRKAQTLRKLKDCAIEVNRAYARRFGINPSLAITTTKPSGTVSQLVNSSSGMHPRHSPFYIRRVRISAHDPLFKMLKDQKITYFPEVGELADSASTFVLEFPIKAPRGAVFRDDLSALDQLEHWKMVKENYTEHNPSVTISVGENEWIEVANWLYQNWNILGGLSFLPRGDHVYQLAPYEKIDKAKYQELEAKMPKLDFSQIVLYEKDDETSGAKELACVGGTCEIEPGTAIERLEKKVEA